MKTLCDCGHTVVTAPDSISTGYGVNSKGEKICYECCAEMDKKTLRETGKLTGYFSGNVFSNWPGTFKLIANYAKTSRHNWGGIRTDYWVRFDGNLYHGVQVGDNSEISTIRKIKNIK